MTLFFLVTTGFFRRAYTGSRAGGGHRGPASPRVHHSDCKGWPGVRWAADRGWCLCSSRCILSTPRPSAVPPCWCSRTPGNRWALSCSFSRGHRSFATLARERAVNTGGLAQRFTANSAEYRRGTCVKLDGKAAVRLPTFKPTTNPVVVTPEPPSRWVSAIGAVGMYHLPGLQVLQPI